jgi:hypothetical protein
MKEYERWDCGTVKFSGFLLQTKLFGANNTTSCLIEMRTMP